MRTVKKWAIEVKRQFIDEEAWKIALASLLIGLLVGFTLAMLGIM